MRDGDYSFRNNVNTDHGYNAAEDDRQSAFMYREPARNPYPHESANCSSQNEQTSYGPIDQAG
jgi:hypothetical protein